MPIALVACWLAGSAVLAQVDLAQDAVRLAIDDAVAGLFESSATIVVQPPTVLGVDVHAGPFVATPDYSARAGAPARFTVFGPGRVRVGEVTAVVSVMADTLRTRRPLRRGETIREADVEIVRRTLDGERFVPLPSADDALGARTARALQTGVTLHTADLVPERAVRSGDPVRLTVHVAGVEVEGVGVALQSGARDDIIAVVNPASRRTLRGRVRGRGEVEVLDVR